MSTIQLHRHLRTWRTRHGSNLVEVARRCGLSESYLSKVERGYWKGTPRPSILDKIAKGYDIPRELVYEWAGIPLPVQNGLSEREQRLLAIFSGADEREIRVLTGVLDVLRAEHV